MRVPAIPQASLLFQVSLPQPVSIKPSLGIVVAPMLEVKSCEVAIGDVLFCAPQLFSPQSN